MIYPAIDLQNGSSVRLYQGDFKQETLASGETWFWSRSRQELWHKGATSGNTQRVVSMTLDCDGDTLLVLVDPKGPACHTGRYSCFFNPIEIMKEGNANDTAES